MSTPDATWIADPPPTHGEFHFYWRSEFREGLGWSPPSLVLVSYHGAIRDDTWTLVPGGASDEDLEEYETGAHYRIRVHENYRAMVRWSRILTPPRPTTGDPHHG